MNLAQAYKEKMRNVSWLLSQCTEFYTESRREIAPVYQFGSPDPRAFTRGQRANTAQFVLPGHDMIKLALIEFRKNMDKIASYGRDEITETFFFKGRMIKITMLLLIGETFTPTVERYLHAKTGEYVYFLSVKYKTIETDGEDKDEYLRTLFDKSESTVPIARVGLALEQLD